MVARCFAMEGTVWLTDKPENVLNLVDGLIEIAKPYTNVGLITYMQIGDERDFAASLAKKIGASTAAARRLRLAVLEDQVNVLRNLGRVLAPYRSHARHLCHVGARVGTGTEKSYRNFAGDGSVDDPSLVQPAQIHRVADRAG